MFRLTPTPRELSSPNVEGSASSRILARQQLQEKVETLQEELKTTKKVLQFLKEDNQRLISENEKSKDINNLKKELAILLSNEDALLQKLNKSQESCDRLVAQNRTLQEEKHELIRSCTEMGNLAEVKKELESAHKRFEVAQKQNRVLTDDLETMQKQLSITDKVLKDQVDNLNKELAIATKSEASLRGNLDNSHKTNEDLLKKLQELQEENVEVKEKSLNETKVLKALLVKKDQLLNKLEDERENLRNDLQSTEDISVILKKDLKDADIERKKLETILREKALALQNLDQLRIDFELENSELKNKLDGLESEKIEIDIKKSNEIEDLKDQLSIKEETINSHVDEIKAKTRSA